MLEPNDPRYDKIMELVDAAYEKGKADVLELVRRERCITPDGINAYHHIKYLLTEQTS